MALLCCSIPCSTEDSKAKARTDWNRVVRISMTNVQWNKRLRHIRSYDRRDILLFNLWERNILKMRPFFVVGCYVLVAQWKVELLYRPHSLQLKSLRSCSSVRDSTVRSSFSFLKLVVIAYGWEDQTVWSTIKSQATDKWRVYKSYFGSRVQQGKGSNRRPIAINDPLQSTTRNGKTCRRTVLKPSVPVVVQREA